MAQQAATAAEPDRDGTGIYADGTRPIRSPREGRVVSAQQAPDLCPGLAVRRILAALIGAFFSAVSILTNWQTPWPQFAILLPGWFLVVAGLRASYDIRRPAAAPPARAASAPGPPQPPGQTHPALSYGDQAGSRHRAEQAATRNRQTWYERSGPPWAGLARACR